MRNRRKSARHSVNADMTHSLVTCRCAVAVILNGISLEIALITSMEIVSSLQSGGGYYLINGPWDLLIAHPPCTDLAVSGARWFREKQMDFRQQKACVFFMRMILSNAERIAVENPVGIMSTCYRKPDQVIQPYEYGHPARKQTCLWLKNLPKLKPTEIVQPEKLQYKCKSGKIVTFSGDYGWGGQKGAKRRSKTYPGIAKAMAEQWG